jgi:hypothetical protein
MGDLRGKGGGLVPDLLASYLVSGPSLLQCPGNLTPWAVSSGFLASCVKASGSPHRSVENRRRREARVCFLLLFISFR